jgi:hypothetical protein
MSLIEISLFIPNFRFCSFQIFFFKGKTTKSRKTVHDDDSASQSSHGRSKSGKTRSLPDVRVRLTDYFKKSSEQTGGECTYEKLAFDVWCCVSHLQLVVLHADR